MPPAVSQVRSNRPEHANLISVMSTLSYEEFLKAVQLRFAMIEVNKSLKASMRKDAEDALDNHNEIKIITASCEPPKPLAVWVLAHYFVKMKIKGVL